MRALVSAFAILAALGLSASPAEAATEATTEASSLEHALAVVIDPAQGVVFANACRAQAGCRAEAGTRFAIPDGTLATKGTVEAIELQNGRTVALVSVPLDGRGGRWVLLLSASAKGEQPKAVKTFRGSIEDVEGGEGEGQQRLLLIDRLPTGARIRFGKRYANADVCGRPSTTQIQQLDPNDMLWSDGPTVSLSDDERDKAIPLTATRSSEPWPADTPRLLDGNLASSAVGRNRAGMTDGDLSTRWAEAKPSAGDGEFLVISASKDVAIDALDFVLRRPSPAPTDAVPKRVFIATYQKVYAVTFPPAATTVDPGTVFTAKLPEPVLSSCLAVVLDEAYAPDEGSQVGLVELRAHTPFEGQSMEQIVAALDDSDKAEAAAALLARNDGLGAEAVIAAYPRLSRDGRRRALDAVSSGSPASTASFYVAVLLGLGAGPDFDPALDPTARIARDRLRANRSSAEKALTKAIRETPPSIERVWAARELSDIAPDAAIGVIVEVLADGSTAPEQPGGADAVRRGLRASLARAANHERDRAKRAVDAALTPAAFGKRSLVEKIDLLRAIGPALPSHADAAAALTQTLGQDDSFRTKYLLLEPAAVLATGGDTGATAFLRDSLSANNQHLRARAAEVSGTVSALAQPLAGALNDDSPRVRRAALAAMTVGAEAATPAVEKQVLRLLLKDRWTFVREEAANALARRPPSPATDRALVATLQDAPKGVRVAALRALGRRGSVSTASAILELADSANEAVFVRTAAIRALSDLCHRDAVPFLYKLALRAGYQQLPYDQPLGMAALSALDHIRPPDLAKQLAPLLARNKIVPPQVRAIARGVLARKAEGCAAR